MDTITINRSLKHHKCFLGTFSRDLLPSKIAQRPAALIINTDLSSEPGKHWVSIFIPKSGPTEYFDSYGMPPLHSEIFDFLALHSSNGWSYSNVTFQHPETSTCGHYCILFVLARCHDIAYSNFVRLFTKEPLLNDFLVQLYTR